MDELRFIKIYTDLTGSSEREARNVFMLVSSRNCPSHVNGQSTLIPNGESETLNGESRVELKPRPA